MICITAECTRHCRGAACRSRRSAADTNRLPIKWHAPIASVAAVTAQPLAALPPYGCGVPFTGGERLWQLHISARLRRPCNAPGLSLRGGRRPTWRPEREARGSALGVQSRVGSYVFAGSTLLSSRVLRDSHVASLLGMTNLGTLRGQRCHSITCQPARRSPPVKGTPHP